MWKAQLVCDACNTAMVEGTNQHYRNAAFAAKQIAFNKGWAKGADKSPVWICASCRAQQSKFVIGDNLIYTGDLQTWEGFNLRGEHARVINTVGVDKVIVVFNNPAADHYHRSSHWFYMHEFVKAPQQQTANHA
jgi:hypothetical protein